MTSAMQRLLLLFYLFVSVNSAPVANDLLDLPFPWPFCTSTTTLTFSGIFTVTSTSTVTSVTSTVTETALPSVTFEKINTTIYSPTAISCISTATTIGPYPAPLITLAARADAPAATPATITTAIENYPTIPIIPTVTVIPPSISSEPCTCLTGTFGLTTDTVTVTTDAVSTTTTTPIETITLTETWVLPTPSSYKGVNYYQYLNNYVYPYGKGGCATCGFGGGGYETSDWNGNYSYYTSGTTQNINFESENYLDWNTIYCKLPGQASATDCSQWTVVFQGFLYATQTGKYTIAPYLGEDNAVFFWSGEKAYSSYANSNVDGGVSYTQPSNVPHSFAYDMVAGEFMPITFIYVNGYGPALNRVTITSPNGTTYPSDLDMFVPPCPNSPFVP